MWLGEGLRAVWRSPAVCGAPAPRTPCLPGTPLLWCRCHQLKAGVNGRGPPLARLQRRGLRHRCGTGWWVGLAGMPPVQPRTAAAMLGLPLTPLRAGVGAAVCRRAGGLVMRRWRAHAQIQQIAAEGCTLGEDEVQLLHWLLENRPFRAISHPSTMYEHLQRITGESAYVIYLIHNWKKSGDIFRVGIFL